MQLLRVLSTESVVTEKEFLSMPAEEITEKLFAKVYKSYQQKRERMVLQTFPVVKDVYENQSQYENIAIPFFDGQKQVQIIANLKRAVDTEGKEIALAFEKGIVLNTIDDAWKEQLREMDDLKQSVQNASYEQKDPLLVYKFESFNLFKKMIEKINNEVVSYLIRADIYNQEQQVFREAKINRGIDRSKIREERGDMLSQAHADTQEHVKPQPVKVAKKVGRNDPCPCGSGKKYKNCCGRNA